jgi:hypothetical protein
MEAGLDVASKLFSETYIMIIAAALLTIVYVLRVQLGHAVQNTITRFPIILRCIMACIRGYAHAGLACSRLFANMFSRILLLPDDFLNKFVTSATSNIVFASNGDANITTRFRLFIRAYARNGSFNVAEYQRVFDSMKLILRIIHGVDPHEYEIHVDTSIIKYRGKPYVLLFNMFSLDGSDCTEDNLAEPAVPAVTAASASASASTSQTHKKDTTSTTQQLLDLMFDNQPNQNQDN